MASVDDVRMYYVDREGNTGSAFGLVMFNLDTLTAEEKAEYEEIKDSPSAVRQWALAHSHSLDGLDGFRYITTPEVKRSMEGPLARMAEEGKL